MKVLLVGNYEFWMCRRTEVLYEGLKENNIEVQNLVNKKKSYWLVLATKLLKNDFDIIIVNGVIPFFVCWFLKIFHRKKIFLDAFISRYNTEVEDKKTVKPGTLKASLLFLSDKMTCRLSDYVFLDTIEHSRYFIDKFKLDKNKVDVVYVGANDKTWKKKKIDVIKNHKFNVVFWGSFSPLQGTDIILDAAKLLKNENDIAFHMLGFSEKNIGKSRDAAIEEGLTNIVFKAGITTDHGLIDYVNSADACLGIFGLTLKAKMVIPHKAFEAIALGKPLITIDSPATREIFLNMENCLLIKGGSASDLAKAVLKLKENKALCKRLSDEAYKLYKERFDNVGIGKKTLEVIHHESSDSMRR